MLLAIDPGNDTGWAVFDSARRLTGCGLGAPANLGIPDEIVIECPELRPRGEKNPNAILKLARNAGEWAGRYFPIPVRYVKPNDWIGGSVDKKINHPRIWAKLDDAERSIVDGALKLHPGKSVTVDGSLAALKVHNILDAIGIGLFGVKR